jgi:hypothetical protein
MKRTLGLFLAVGLAACSTKTSVSRDYDPKQDFTPLKTWAWAPEPTPADASNAEVSSLTQERIRTAIQQELGAKNFQQVDPKDASFLVHYTAMRRAYTAGPRYDYYGSYDGDVYLVDVGTLVIDITSPKDKRLIWRGVGYRTIDPELTPEQREKQTQELTHEILSSFPPEKK